MERKIFICAVLSLTSIFAFGMKKNIKVVSDKGGSSGPWKCANTWSQNTQHVVTKFKSGEIVCNSTKYLNSVKTIQVKTPKHIERACLAAIKKYKK